MAAVALQSTEFLHVQPVGKPIAVTGAQASRMMAAISEHIERGVRFDDLKNQRGLGDVRAWLCQDGAIVAGTDSAAMGAAYKIQSLLEDGLMPSVNADNDNGASPASIDHARGAFGSAASGSLSTRVPPLGKTFSTAHGVPATANRNPGLRRGGMQLAA